ncbi:MAG: hypothetical protein JSR67_03680 [Proteobacteria bacterium]|nr:hypothetical protein [Pseudomonadota bacterium]
MADKQLQFRARNAISGLAKEIKAGELVMLSQEQVDELLPLGAIEVVTAPAAKGKAKDGE